MQQKSFGGAKPEITRSEQAKVVANNNENNLNEVQSELDEAQVSNGDPTLAD